MDLRSWIKRLLTAILDWLSHPAPPQIIVRIQVDDVSLEVSGGYMLRLPIDQTVAASLKFEDAAGNPAVVDGPPQWDVQPPGLVDMVVAEDGLSAQFTPTGTLGTAQVTVMADALIGEGVTTLTLTGSIETIGGMAVGGTIEFGEPQPK